ncbi:MAG TPA: tetratricopeptide repeat protein [Xanthomonadaceae bacterium]|nr:tetratricopeptide repeat protein [Xanthomonadaceae bacterium]
MAALVGVACSRSGSVDMSACTKTQGDPKAMIAACTTVIASGRLDDADLATAYINRAAGYASLKDSDHALADLDALIQRQPNNAAAFGYRGIAYGIKGDMDRAIADFEQAIRIDPNVDWAYANLGHAYEGKHDYIRAQQSYSRAVVLRPDNRIAWDGRCWSRAVIGKELDAASTDCDTSLELGLHDGSNPANALNSRGFVDFRKQQYKDAIRDDDASIASDPTIASSYYIRGLAKLAMGDATGQSDVAQAMSLEPGVAKRYAGYGIPSVR